jgi:hypothetical protein
MAENGDMFFIKAISDISHGFVRISHCILANLSVNEGLTNQEGVVEMAYAPPAKPPTRTITVPTKPASAVSKTLHFGYASNAKLQRVQESLTAARKGNGPFGLKG